MFFGLLGLDDFWYGKERRGEERTSLFTSGSSSSVWLNASGARNIIASTIRHPEINEISSLEFLNS